MTPSEKITMLRQMLIDRCIYNGYVAPAKAGEVLDQTATLADEVQALQSDLLTARCENEELQKENTDLKAQIEFEQKVKWEYVAKCEALEKLADAVGAYKEKAKQMAQATDKTFN